MRSFGISDLCTWLPSPSVRLEDLIARRQEQGVAAGRLRVAQELTGQERLRIPDWYEDTVTMVAEAASRLAARQAAGKLATVRHLLCGTESGNDAAKPLSAYLGGLLQQDGWPIGFRLASCEVKHACAAGTYGLLGALQALFVESQRQPGGTAIVTMGDIASYRPGTTAELTQGAGAVALLVEENPALLAIDLGVTGYWSESVDDFFRALPDRHATVRGRYSMECYQRALMGAYNDYKERALACGLLRRPAAGHFLDTIDYMVLHAPFASLPLRAMVELLQSVRGMSEVEALAEVDRLHISDGLHMISQTGNLYTGSLYLCLADLLEREHERLGPAIEGKRLLLASYGSGNTMVLFGGTVVPGASAVIARMAVREGVATHCRPLSAAQYDALLEIDKHSPAGYEALFATRQETIPAEAWHLARIREDRYRLYARRQS